MAISVVERLYRDHACVKDFDPGRDGSPASLCALDYAIEMAIQNPGSSFVVLNVQNVSATELSGEFMEGVQERLLQAADKALKEAKARCEAANIPFETFVRTGPIA